MRIYGKCIFDILQQSTFISRICEYSASVEGQTDTDLDEHAYIEIEKEGFLLECEYLGLK